MNLVGRNCQPRTVRVLKEIIKSHKPSILFLSETLVEGNEIEVIASKIGYSNFFSVDRYGRSGGLVVFWRNNIRCSVVDSSQNHIDITVKESHNVMQILTCFYGFPERERRKLLGIFCVLQPLLLSCLGVFSVILMTYFTARIRRQTSTSSELSRRV